MFENLTIPHLLMVMFIAMLLFGAKRIPEIAGSMGKGIREFKKNVHEATNDVLPAAAPVERAAEEQRSEPKRLA